MSVLDSYREVTPKGTIDFLRCLAEKIRGRRILHVNSTRVGGGVAEILRSLVPLLKDIGVEARWEVITGTEDFFAVTKAFHNSLQGEEQDLSPEMLETYREINRKNAQGLDLNADYVIIHDPQPAALILQKPGAGRWIWRCHIDISHPQRKVWNFLRQYVVQYDGAIFSLPRFAQRLPIPQFLIYPSIDPLSDKNRDLSPGEQEEILDRLRIPRDKPILLQVSRFDRFKDPLGVIQAYRLVKKHHDVRLILAGGGATDDPGGRKGPGRGAPGRPERSGHLDPPPPAGRQRGDQRPATRRHDCPAEISPRGVRFDRGRGHVEGKTRHRRICRGDHRPVGVRRDRVYGQLPGGGRLPHPFSCLIIRTSWPKWGKTPGNTCGEIF